MIEHTKTASPDTNSRSLPVEERYTPTGKVIVGCGPFRSDRTYLLDLLLLFHASPLDSLQVRDSSERGFNTFLFKNNDNGTFTLMWTVSSQQGKGNGRTGKSGNGSTIYGTHDILQSTFNNNGKAVLR